MKIDSQSYEILVRLIKKFLIEKKIYDLYEIDRVRK